MSHSVTITRMTTVTSGTNVYINRGFVSTVQGLLTLTQLILGAACVGVMTYYYDHGYYRVQKEELFFMLVAVAFLIGTFCLLLSSMASVSSVTMMSKTPFEVIYNGIGCILYLAASITLLNAVNQNKRSNTYEPYLAASIMGLVLAVLYLISTVFAFRSYRGF